jgi:hypothetical protein
VSAGFFSVASDSSMCPGVDSASKNEYEVIPEGKGGRCVRLTTYHLHVPMSRHLRALTSWNPAGLFRPVMGQLYLVYIPLYLKHNGMFSNKNNFYSVIAHWNQKQSTISRILPSAFSVCRNVFHTPIILGVECKRKV